MSERKKHIKKKPFLISAEGAPRKTRWSWERSVGRVDLVKEGWSCRIASRKNGRLQEDMDSRWGGM